MERISQGSLCSSGTRRSLRWVGAVASGAEQHNQPSGSGQPKFCSTSGGGPVNSGKAMFPG